MNDLKDELSNHNLSLYRKALQHWDTLLAEWIVYFNPRYDPSDLATFLRELIKRITTFDPIFAFCSKKVYNTSQQMASALKYSAVKKKKQDDELLKTFHIEVLNNHKAGIVLALKKIFDSDV